MAVCQRQCAKGGAAPRLVWSVRLIVRHEAVLPHLRSSAASHAEAGARGLPMSFALVLMLVRCKGRVSIPLNKPLWCMWVTNRCLHGHLTLGSCL